MQATAQIHVTQLASILYRTTHLRLYTNWYFQHKILCRGHQYNISCSIVSTAAWLGLLAGLFDFYKRVFAAVIRFKLPSTAALLDTCIGGDRERVYRGPIITLSLSGSGSGCWLPLTTFGCAAVYYVVGRLWFGGMLPRHADGETTSFPPSDVRKWQGPFLSLSSL